MLSLSKDKLFWTFQTFNFFQNVFIKTFIKNRNIYFVFENNFNIFLHEKMLLPFEGEHFKFQICQKQILGCPSDILVKKKTSFQLTKTALVYHKFNFVHT